MSEKRKEVSVESVILSFSFLDFELEKKKKKSYPTKFCCQKSPNQLFACVSYFLKVLYRNKWKYFIQFQDIRIQQVRNFYEVEVLAVAYWCNKLHRLPFWDVVAAHWNSEPGCACSLHAESCIKGVLTLQATTLHLLHLLSSPCASILLYCHVRPGEVF